MYRRCVHRTHIIIHSRGLAVLLTQYDNYLIENWKRKQEGQRERRKKRRGKEGGRKGEECRGRVEAERTRKKRNINITDVVMICVLTCDPSACSHYFLLIPPYIHIYSYIATYLPSSHHLPFSPILTYLPTYPLYLSHSLTLIPPWTVSPLLLLLLPLPLLSHHPHQP